MPWLSIAIWLLTFIASGGLKSGGAAKAALLATGAGLASWYLADPANPQAAFDVFKTQQPSSGSNSGVPSVSTTSGQSGGSTVDTIVKEAVSLLKSWGPTGTTAALAGTAAVFGGGIFKNVPTWLLLGGGALILWRVLGS